MPAIDLSVILIAPENGVLSGYLDASQGLHFPVLDASTGQGPALSGSWSEEGFSLQTDQPYTVELDSGQVATVTLELYEGVIEENGDLLTGKYRETVSGLTPEPMMVTGSFELWRLPQALPPFASFQAIPVAGPAPLTVQFNDLSGNGPTTWNWDFGDGGTSTEQHPSHTYAADGVYTINFTVSNASGSHSLTLPDYIVVGEKLERRFLPIVKR
jgi:PKD repeat protein